MVTFVNHRPWGEGLEPGLFHRETLDACHSNTARHLRCWLVAPSLRPNYKLLFIRESIFYTLSVCVCSCCFSACQVSLSLTGLYHWQDLMDRDHLNQEKIEVEKAKLSKYTEDKNNEILGYNNQVQ